jgi:Phosphate-selective porin O and P
MRSATLAGLASLLLLTAPARPAAAHEINEQLTVFGYSQLWFTLYEQMEEAAGLNQHPSGDAAAASASGLSLRRARLGARVALFDGALRFFTQFKLEDDPSFTDAVISLHLAPWLSLHIGQQKIPSTYENLTFTAQLDFLERAAISTLLADYSLSRTTYASSLFYGVRSNLRDLGLAARGELELEPLSLRYFVMLGNGLGANLFIGGGTHKEYIITNNGQFFYGARLEAARIFDVVSVGGHLSYNRHDDMVFNSGRVVYDLDRRSYSADLQLRVPGTGLRLAGLFGAGVIDDDFDDDGRTDLRYRGGEGRLVWRLNPLLRRLVEWDALEQHIFELAFRYDNVSSEWNGTGVLVQRHTWTAGINYLWEPHLRVQLNVIFRAADDPDKPDLADDALLLGVQGYI